MKLETEAQHTLARDVAAALSRLFNHEGPGKREWATAKPDNWGDPETAPLHLAGPNGERLWINTNWRDSSKICVSGEFQRGKDGYSLMPYGTTVPSISVSMTRGAETIAKEIKRRLLPAYNEVFVKVQERLKSSEEFYAGRESGLKALEEVLGDIARRQNPERVKETDQYLDFASWTNFYGKLTPSSGSVTMDLHSVPMPLALEICKAMRAYFDNQKAGRK